MGRGACDMSFNTGLISEERWWSPSPPTLSCWEVIVSERWEIRPQRKKSTITGCFPVLFQVMKDVANNPRTHRDRGEEWWTIGHGNKGVLTDLCLKGLLSDLCLTLYIFGAIRVAYDCLIPRRLHVVRVVCCVVFGLEYQPIFTLRCCLFPFSPTSEISLS
jgi:hypothetical protein